MYDYCMNTSMQYILVRPKVPITFTGNVIYILHSSPFPHQSVLHTLINFPQFALFPSFFVPNPIFSHHSIHNFQNIRTIDAYASISPNFQLQLFQSTVYTHASIPPTQNSKLSTTQSPSRNVNLSTSAGETTYISHHTPAAHCSTAPLQPFSPSTKSTQVSSTYITWPTGHLTKTDHITYPSFIIHIILCLLNSISNFSYFQIIHASNDARTRTYLYHLICQSLIIYTIDNQLSLPLDTRTYYLIPTIRIHIYN